MIQFVQLMKMLWLLHMVILVYKSLFKGNWAKGVNNILYPL